MKVLLILIALTISSKSINAQQNYVEVVVSENINLAATEFIYTIKSGSIYDEYEDAMMEFESTEGYDGELETLDEFEDEVPNDDMQLGQLKAILSKKNIQYTVLSATEGSSDMQDHWKVRAVLTSLSTLESLSSQIDKAEGVYGELDGVNYESIDSHCDRAYPNLLVRAKKRANLLATGAGKKVGVVLQISEGKEVVNGVQEWSEYTAKLIESLVDRKRKGLELTRPAIISLTYRFELL